MATVCDVCGKRDNEVKSGSGIEPAGTRITLRITDASDLSRDVLKVRWSRAGSGVERIDLLHFLAGCHKRQLNKALAVLSLSLGLF